MTPETLTEFNALLMTGNWRQCMETYYADQVEVFEGNMKVASSLEENISREEVFLKGVEKWNDARILNEAVGENVTMTEWYLDFNHAEYGHKQGNQVAVQHWHDGKVVHERYYSLYHG